MSIDRSQLIVGAAALVLMVAALFPWSQGPSGALSFVDRTGRLMVAADGHWTEYAARTIAYTAGMVFLGVALGLFSGGPLMTAVGWCVAALLLALAPWMSEFAPEQVVEKRLVFREMNRVANDMDSNYFEQQIDWRSEQRFTHDMIIERHGVLRSESMSWSEQLSGPDGLNVAFEAVLGFTHEFFAFFHRKLLAALIVAIIAILLGLHLRDGRGLMGLRQGVAWGSVCGILVTSVALTPKVLCEYSVLCAVDAWNLGDRSRYVDCLRTASVLRPELTRLCSYHAALGRAAQLKENVLSLEVCYANAYDFLMSGTADLGVDELRRAQTLNATDPMLRHFLGLGLTEAGIQAFNDGQYSLAREYWDESISLMPINPMPWYGLALFYLRLKDFDQYARCLDQLVRIHDYFGYQRLTIRAQAHVAHCWAAAHNDNWETAHAMYCKSVRPESW